MTPQKETSPTTKSPPKNTLGERLQPAKTGDASASLYQRLTRWITSGYRHIDEGSLLEEVLAVVAEHFPCDLVEINLLDESVGFLLPNRWAGSSAIAFLKNQAADRYQIGVGYTGWIAEHKRPLLVADIDSNKELIPTTGLDTFPFKSYIGVPIQWDDQLLGTLELAHHAAEVYKETDAEALTSVAAPLALALHVYHLQETIDQQAVQAETSDALFQLADPITEFEELWKAATYKLLDMLDLSLLGLFIQDEAQDTLSTPYLCYRAGKTWKHRESRLSIPMGSDLSAIWKYQEYWVSNHVDAEVLSKLDLATAVKPASAKKLVITPLLAGNERFGLMIAGRLKKQSDFSEQETLTFASLARRAGLLLYNSRRISQPAGFFTPGAEGGAAYTLEEAQASMNPERMAELLRLSAELTTSMDLDRSLRQVLSLCNDLVMADMAVFITQNHSTGKNEIRQVMPENEPHVNGESQQVGSISLKISDWITAHQQSLLLNNLENDGRWAVEPFNSLCAVPCITENNVTGALLFFAKRPAAFSEVELQIAQLVGRQMAGALNNSYLYKVIHEQADRLGLMLRSQQIESSQSNAILEAIADGVIVTDADHNVILYNDAAERILNLSAAQIVGKPIFEHIGIFGSETLHWGEMIRQWQSTSPDAHQPVTTPERMILEDGRIISILPAPVVLGGDFLGTVSIFRDISREVEVDRLKSEFVATVSHELRTPMTSIKGFIDLMLIGAAGEMSDEQRHFLNIVQTNTNRLEILVNDLLDISRIEAGKATLVFQELDVHQLLQEMEQYLQHRCQEESKSIQFDYEAPAEIAPIWGDLERVRQILANIVENGFAYTPDGGSIHMHAHQVNGDIEIEVIDTGMGISLEEQERIFERFYRGEQALIMGVPGTGLGLAIVLNLLEMHNGRIWVTSEGSGKGSSFTVSLPSAVGKSKK